MGETVFLGYDQAALDREYNNSGKIPNAAEYLAWYPGESARTRETLPARLDLRYGPQPGETLDVFLPEGRGPWPVHVFVHGGYWRSLDKQDFSFVARGLQPAAVLVAVVNYALIPDGRHGRAGPAGARVGGVAPPERGRPRRRSRQHHGLRPFGRRPPHRDADVDGLARLRRPAGRRGQGRLRHQRALRPRADPALLPQPDPRAHDGDGAPEQPGPPGPGGRRSRCSSPSGRRRATSTTARPNRWPRPGAGAAVASR